MLLKGYASAWIYDLPSHSIGYPRRRLSSDIMLNTSGIEIEKLNGYNFELWKLKIEDLLVDQEQWILLKLAMILIGTSKGD